MELAIAMLVGAVVVLVIDDVAMDRRLRRLESEIKRLRIFERAQAAVDKGE